LESAGELERVTDLVDWKYELGARSRRISQTAPALLFENIKQYPGHQLLTNGLGTYSRIAIALGLEATTTFREIVDAFRRRLTHPVAPVSLGESPLLECVSTGNEVNLEKFPVPWFHQSDGGRYVGTWHLNVTKDPENGLRNIGVYRMQLLNAKTTAISVSPGSHLARHLAKAEKKGEALEMGVAIGVDETLIMAAAASPTYGADEYAIAGGLSREAIVLSECLTVGLEVPAFAEIVLEGKIRTDSKVMEGPFLDYAGIPKADPNARIFEVTCIMHRENPIFRGAAIGLPGGEDHLLFSLLSAADCLDFHGSGIRQRIQNGLLKKRAFNLFQYVGRLRQLLAGR